MMKIGRTSAPGTNSTKDTNPIQRNMAKQTKIPTTSNTSPTTGIVNTMPHTRLRPVSHKK